ncbi:hypothetical protein EDB81DRAFT_791504 [Dactylonectria macrodidyma]|uniref:Uncharacterized protein n=1 Tax=Dactylonectria macrodidyma TaxID=307937 RepID=A0A9P9F4H6_9HYPO|nr:hypothetical protein EDB81DRAFT_791504 [Dactylonectria macrodidyma]
MTHQPRLPLELILQIVEASLPGGGPQFIANVSTPGAQLLVAWSQVCRATYEPATRLLRQHFIYIDSFARLRAFLRCLSASKASGPASTLPPAIPPGSISSIYLGLSMDPFLGSVAGSLMIGDLFIELGDSVRRLILDVPLRSLDQESGLDMAFDQRLSEGLSALSNVEEFVSAGGLPTLDFWRHESNFWKRWPKLRRLAGFQANIAEESLWYHVARARALEQVVISHSHLLRVDKWNFKRAIAKYWRLESGGDPILARRMRIVLADHEFTPSLIDDSEGDKNDPMGLVSVSKFAVPISGSAFVKTDDACREWMIQAAKEGTLWG